MSKYNAGFVSRELTRMSFEKYDELRKKGILEECKFVDADDWQMIIPEVAKDSKYSRMMFSEKLNRLRKLTIGEFYGSGTVD
jgi:hypothetical protein